MSEKIKISNTNGIGREEKSIAIIGGGLVGALAALHLGRKGINVDLYEFREDIRESKLVIGRSINLSLSKRGRNALAEVGLEEELLRHGIPMRGRMLHDLHGTTTSIPYDSNKKQCIYSVGRKFLNEVLLTAAEKYPNIKLHFNQKLVGANLQEGELTFFNCQTNETTNSTVDLVVGCDGAFSTVRGHLLKRPGFNFSQTYIEHGYLELCIPAKDNQFQMAENHLHIWPRGKFMMIALPNQDKTWTVTLFMPFDNFSKIKTREDLLEFFGTHFPDAIPLISEEKLTKDFFKTQPQPLVSIKCKPYNLSNKVLLMGDAAHAMVPFYGQGMNAGFEDVTLFSNILEKHNHNYEEALKEFSETRWENAHAICDLAMYNYIEMRDLVTRRSYRLRKCVDDFLSWMMPATWVPLYNSISFTDMPYKECVENRKWQDKMLSRLMLAATCIVTGSLAIGGVRAVKTSGIPFGNFPGFYL